MKLLWIVLGLSAAGTAAFLAFASAWSGWELSFHLWIALGLGTFLSLALGGGLTALMFYSARQGYDDRVEPDRGDESN
ncbi:MAG: hypothetical protein ABL883_03430 [Terricaulis sp.]